MKTCRRFGWTLSLAYLALAATAAGHGARAQGITVDGRLSAARTLAGPNYAIDAELGKQKGGNLFHSFGRFGLNRGESATFSGPASVNNVIGRVTGGAASSIDGTVRSAIPGANLYLINPAGVVFGPNARVDVSGSFHASSANYLRLRDGARFQATNPDGSTLSAAPPEAFGFLSANPRPVEVSGAGLGPVAGRTLGLVGGPVTISGGVLYAPAGTVHVASAAGPGEVPVDPRAGPAPAAARPGPVRIERSLIAVSDEAGRTSGGSVFVRAGTLDIAASAIDADNHGPGPGGEVSLRGDGAVAIRGRPAAGISRDGVSVRAVARADGRGADIGIGTAPGGSVAVDAATVEVGSRARGEGGALSITGGALAVRNGGVVLSTARERGNGGPISVNADSVLLEGAGTGILSQTSGAALVDEVGRRVPAGAGGLIRLRGGTLTLQDGAAGLLASTTGDGAGGAIEVDMAGSVSILNAFGIAASALPDAQGRNGQGRGGDVRVTTRGNLVIDNGDAQLPAGISATTSGGGDAGSVTVGARGDITIHGNATILSNASNATKEVAVTVTAEGDLLLVSGGPDQLVGIGGLNQRTGDGGAVLVTARNVTLLGNTGIVAGTFTGGRSGAVTVRAEGGDLLFDNQGGGQEAQIGSGTILEADNSPGNAGPVKVEARNITLRGNAGITSFNTRGGTGEVGALTVAAAGALTLDGGGFIRADTANPSKAADVVVSAAGRITLVDASKISSSTSAAGRAGTVTVGAGALSLAHQGVISSGTSGPGEAGQVEVTVRDGGALTIDGTGDTAAFTGIASQAEASSTGNAGTVRVKAGSLSIQNAGGISSASLGAGAGGTVTVEVDGGLSIAGTSGLGEFAGITTETRGEGPAGRRRGGDVRVSAGSDIRLTGAGARISAFSVGAGEAGSIAVSAPQVVLRDGAVVSTQAQTANGGNITISPGDLLHLQISRVTTSVGAGSGNGGNIAVGHRFVVLDRSLIQANAESGNGGNVRIGAGAFVQSASGSAVTATSVAGVSGEIAITGVPLNLSGSLVVLASELRAAAALLREGCAARGGSPRSSLVVAGRGGQRQGTGAAAAETSLPALYLAHRPVRAGEEQQAPEVPPPPPLHTSITLSARCG